MSTNLVAFYPKGIIAPRRFLSVYVPNGEVSTSEWLDGMENRIQMMLSKEFFKKRAANKVCKLLGCYPCQDLDYFGEHIVKGELGFLTWINNSVINDYPFPVIVTENDKDALWDIENTDLKTWAGLAKLVLSGIMLSGYLNFENYSQMDAKTYIQMQEERDALAL